MPLAAKNLVFFGVVFVISAILEGCAHGTENITLENGGNKLPLNSASSLTGPQPISDGLSDTNPKTSRYPPWTPPAMKPSGSCPGVRLGTYTWDMSYFLTNNGELLDLLDSPIGREYACGDLYINVADYSSPDIIPEQANLIQLIKEYRRRIGNWEATVFLTYGDVTARDGMAMIAFTETFFDWAKAVSAADADAMGRIGISYDVEHVDPEATKTALLMCKELRLQTAFKENIVSQHTIDGDRNILTTDYVMKYADSALAMLYSNTPDGLVDLIQWLVTEQCEKCLVDEYSSENYNAKISVIVEASCKMGNGCSQKSMCIRDGENEGVMYIAETVSRANELLGSRGVLSAEQYSRLFNLESQWVVHNFEWERCYAPFNKFFTYDSCKNYHDYANSCKNL